VWVVRVVAGSRLYSSVRQTVRELCRSLEGKCEDDLTWVVLQAPQTNSTPLWQTYTDTQTDIYTVFRKKTPNYVFNYNSGISWSIFIIFVAVEREINTLQFTYLRS